jgi:hypothetical protein
MSEPYAGFTRAALITHAHDGTESALSLLRDPGLAIP